MALKYMNSIKIAAFTLSFIGIGFIELNAETPKSLPKKAINYGNAAKAAILMGTSLSGALCHYYGTMFSIAKLAFCGDCGGGEPSSCHLCGWANVPLKFNKKFVIKHPKQAAFCAAPLVISIFSAVLARDYFKRIWKREKNKQTQDDVLNNK